MSSRAQRRRRQPTTTERHMIDRLLVNLRMLAAPGDEWFGVRPAEIALDFSDALRLVMDCPQVQLSAEQEGVLERLDEQLDAWTEGRHPGVIEREAVRRLAAAALDALGNSA